MRIWPAFAAILLISTAALAQDAPGSPPPPAPPGAAAAPGAPHMNWRQRFEAANTTHDGKLTREQAEAGGMRGIARRFDAVDTDKKGYITLQDLRAYAQARRAERAQQAPAQQ